VRPVAIVAGTDFSDQGSIAVRAGAALASRLRQPLWLVHVLDDAIEALDPRARDVLLSAADGRLRGEARHLRAAVRRRTRTRVLVGHAWDGLTSLPDGSAPALVVVSSPGHGASPLFRLSGTSERIAATSPVPVLVARAAEPFEAWARRTRRLRVVLGVDLEGVGDTAIEWVRMLRRAGPCDVTVAHVYHADEAHRRYGLRAASLLTVNPRLERWLRRDLASRVGPLPGAGKVVYRPLPAVGRLADHLVALAVRQRADLIVVGTQHRRGLARLASVASGTLHMGRSAVAVIPNSFPISRRLTGTSPRASAAAESIADSVCRWSSLRARGT